MTVLHLKLGTLLAFVTKPDWKEVQSLFDLYSVHE